MNDQIRFHPRVPHDLAEATKWYDEIAPAIGHRFRQAVRESFNRVRLQPLLFGVVFDDVRFLRVAGFPYIVQYRLIGETPYALGVFLQHATLISGETVLAIPDNNGLNR